MGSDFPITEAILTGGFVVSVVWGFHIVSLGFCMHALFTSWQRGQKTLNWWIVAVAWILFANATFDMTLAIHHMIRAFVSTDSPESAALKYAIPDWTNVARTTSVVVQTIIGDAVLIYRCWIVYDQSFFVIAPSAFLWFGLLGSTIWAIFLEATLNVLFSARQIGHSITVFLVDTSRVTTQSIPLQFASPAPTSRHSNSKTEIYVSSSVLREVTEPVSLKT